MRKKTKIIEKGRERNENKVKWEEKGENKISKTVRDG